MALVEGTEGADFLEAPDQLGDGQTGNRVLAKGGDDTVVGSVNPDSLFGQDGDDELFGQQNNDGSGDLLDGGDGNDILNGSAGDDVIVGDNNLASEDDGANNDDTLQGFGGDDELRGGVGDDDYVYFKQGGGQDTINEDLSSAGSTGFGGGDDYLFMEDIASNEVQFFQNGNNLEITDATDAEDGSVDAGVIVENFFDGGDNVVESLVTSDDLVFDLTTLLG